MSVTGTEDDVQMDEVMEWALAHAEIPRRIAGQVVKTPEGCWEWTGRDNGVGYARIGFEGEHTYLHRVLYERLVGPIPDGYELDHHVCRYPPCCNPAHAEPVTHAENGRRGGRDNRVWCRVGECEVHQHARGLCRKHYNAWYRSQ